MKIDDFLDNIKISVVKKSDFNDELYLVETKSLQIKFMQIYENYTKDAGEILKNPAVKKLLDSGLDLKNIDENELMKKFSSDEILEIKNSANSKENNKKEEERNKALIALFDEKKLKKLLDQIFELQIKNLNLGGETDFSELKKEMLPQKLNDIANAAYEELYDHFLKPRKAQ